MADLVFKRRGSIVLVRAETTRGQEWLDENIDASNATWQAGSIVLKPRRALDMVKRAMADGLIVE